MKPVRGQRGTEVVGRGDPSPLRWLIGVELARFRNAHRLALSEVSARLQMSRAKVGHLETGHQQQSPDDIAAVLKLYGAEQRDIDRLTSLAGRADDATWWAAWANLVPDWLKTFVGLEGLAAREFVFEPLIIPGLLQTEAYAEIVTAGTPRVRADHGERFVGFRMARARRLSEGDHPLHLHAVIGEAALRLRVGTAEVRRDQLSHLVRMAELPNVTIQVLRPEDGLHTAMTGQFVVLDFDEARSIAYAELHDGSVYVQDPDQVRSYSLVAENLQRVALGPTQSSTLIKSMTEA
ncbi:MULTISPECIES: helix-turn-helix domain-containing protein [Actinoalloteichus]|uniref:helix-turn-helix domain-containing protein n=1 Tax=Actinoalloteichus TaxID=65496 RepID=UPI000952D3F1|nr:MULTISPECIES: helix-turn-helix transcriptional regulator [Actinoalloteichus]